MFAAYEVMCMHCSRHHIQMLQAFELLLSAGFPTLPCTTDRGLATEACCMQASPVQRAELQKIRTLQGKMEAELASLGQRMTGLQTQHPGSSDVASDQVWHALT